MPRFLLLFAFFLNAFSWAQAPLGSLHGVVTVRVETSSGVPVTEPVLGARVTVKNIAVADQEWHVVTDSSGVFAVEGLPASHYSVQVETSYGSTTLQDIPLADGESKQLAIPFAASLLAAPAPISPAMSGSSGPRARHKKAARPPAPPPPPPPQPIPTIAVPTNPNYTSVRIFYATDRQQGDTSQPALFYTGLRRSASQNGAALELGQCQVSIPRIHETGELESPVWWKLEFRPDPERHIVLLSVKPEDADSYFSDLRAQVAGSSSKDAFVFIHGYNTTFEDAARRTAQMAYDLHFQGAPILYSWPSFGELTKYTYDETNVEWSWRHLADFLETLSQKSGATTIHLIAHSMGNRALTNALQRLPRSATPMFREVILAAPDIDADVFKQMAADMQGKASRITLYASSKDEALRASKLAHGEPRAGDSDRIVIVPGVDSIDASSAATDFLGHGYVFKDSILYDINNLFRQGKPPQQRDRLKPEQLGSLLYWFLAP